MGKFDLKLGSFLGVDVVSIAGVVSAVGVVRRCSVLLSSVSLLVLYVGVKKS